MKTTDNTSNRGPLVQKIEALTKEIPAKAGTFGDELIEVLTSMAVEADTMTSENVAEKITSINANLTRLIDRLDSVTKGRESDTAELFEAKGFLMGCQTVFTKLAPLIGKLPNS